MPPLLGPSPTPPTAAAAELLQLLLRPLQALLAAGDARLLAAAVRQLCGELLAPPEPSEQVRLFLLPALAAAALPLLPALVEAVLDPALAPTPALLHAFLLLAEPALHTVREGEEERFLAALAALARTIPALLEEEGEEEEEEEAMVVEEGAGEVALVTDAIAVLNRREVVAGGGRRAQPE